MRKRPIVALIYDFDGTLSPGNMQEFGFIQAVGKTKEEFWRMSDGLAVGQDASNVLAYMKMMFDEARKNGIKAGLIRPITLWPFPKDVLAKAAEHVPKFLTVEMSMGQMVDDVRLAIECSRPVEFYGRTGGVIPTPMEVYDRIVKINGGEQ